MSSVYSSQRRRDPQPLGRAGESALVALCAGLLAVSLAALVGLGVASLLAGGGWVWPHGSNTDPAVLRGLLAGHPGRGLPPQLAVRVPGPGAVYTGVALAELALLAVGAVGGVLVARYHRPGDARAGMASRAQAAQVLGTARLRQGKTLIRPDLYGPHHAEPRPAEDSQPVEQPAAQ